MDSGFSDFAEWNDAPPNQNSTYDNKGQGIPQMTKNNSTIHDILRTPFLLTHDHKKDFRNQSTVALQGVQANSEMSKIFFSTKNIVRLQKRIKREVFKRTNGKYKLDIDQEERDLLIVMRSIYLEFGRFLPGQIIRQVKRLNNKVIDEILPSMLTEIRQYYGYLDDINEPIKPLMRPLNVSNAGRRLLPSVTSTFGID
jgi:hypothetical protein